MASHAQLPYGWHDLGGAFKVAATNGNDSRAYADILASTSPFQDRVNRLALAERTPLLARTGSGALFSMRFAKA